MAQERFEVFGIDAGGPNAADVHQDRLVLIGSGIVPDAMAASRVGKWTDFRFGVLQDTDNPTMVTPVNDVVADADITRFVKTPADGFWLYAGTGRGGEFHALLKQEGLFVFGRLGESVVPPGLFAAATAEVRENSWYGSERGRTPVIAGGLTIFVQRGGEDVRAMNWSEEERKYLAVSMLSQAGTIPFRKARDMTYRGSRGRDPDLLFVVDEDGSVGVASLHLLEMVAWSRWSFRLNPPGQPDTASDGKVRAAATPLGELAFLTERDGEIALETEDVVSGGDLWDDEPITFVADPLVPFVVRQGGRSRTFARRITYEPPAPVVEWLRAKVGRRVLIDGERFELNAVDVRRREAPYVTRDAQPVPGATGVGRPGAGTYRVFPPGSVLVSLDSGDPKPWKPEGGEVVTGVEPSWYIFETLPFVEVSESGIQRSLRARAYTGHGIGLGGAGPSASVEPQLPRPGLPRTAQAAGRRDAAHGDPHRLDHRRAA